MRGEVLLRFKSRNAHGGARMSHARLFSLLTIALASIAQISFADDIAPDIQNSRNAALCIVNSDGVYVRSAAGENYYPTAKLNKGDQVTVVGEKFDWLKVIP